MEIGRMLDFDKILWTKKYTTLQAIGLGFAIGFVISVVLVAIAYFLL